MKDNEQKIKPAPRTGLGLVRALPLIIGPLNAEAVTGFPYRWCRDTAARLGVPFVGAGRKRGIRADLFLAALERQPEEGPANNTESVVVDPAEEVRERLRRAGER